MMAAEPIAASRQQPHAELSRLGAADTAVALVGAPHDPALAFEIGNTRLVVCGVRRSARAISALLEPGASATVLSTAYWASVTPRSASARSTAKRWVAAARRNRSSSSASVISRALLFFCP